MDKNNTEYGERNENGSTIKFETKVIKSSLCDYSDVYILVTGNIVVMLVMLILGLHLKIVLYLWNA